MSCLFFFFNDTATTEIYTLSLHDALPILLAQDYWHNTFYANEMGIFDATYLKLRELRLAYDLPPSVACAKPTRRATRSEEHTSELQSPCNLVCRLLLEKKKNINIHMHCQSYYNNSYADFVLLNVHYHLLLCSTGMTIHQPLQNTIPTITTL